MLIEFNQQNIQMVFRLIMPCIPVPSVLDLFLEFYQEFILNPHAIFCAKSEDSESLWVVPTANRLQEENKIKNKNKLCSLVRNNSVSQFSILVEITQGAKKRKDSKSLLFQQSVTKPKRKQVELTLSLRELQLTTF